jgi:hypothetical protein
MNMARLDERTRANLDVALEEVCREFPHGGDHALRKKIALRLLQSARKGNISITGLSTVAQTAMAEATKRGRPA